MDKKWRRQPKELHTVKIPIQCGDLYISSKKNIVYTSTKNIYLNLILKQIQDCHWANDDWLDNQLCIGLQSQESRQSQALRFSRWVRGVRGMQEMLGSSWEPFGFKGVSYTNHSVKQKQEN